VALFGRRSVYPMIWHNSIYHAKPLFVMSQLASRFLFSWFYQSANKRLKTQTRRSSKCAGVGAKVRQSSPLMVFQLVRTTVALMRRLTYTTLAKFLALFW